MRDLCFFSRVTFLIKDQSVDVVLSFAGKYVISLSLFKLHMPKSIFHPRFQNPERFLILFFYSYFEDKISNESIF